MVASSASPLELPPGWRVMRFERYLVENGGGCHSRVDFLNPEGFLKARIVTTIARAQGYSVAVEIIRSDSVEGTHRQQDPLPELRQLRTEWLNAMNQAMRCWNQVAALLNQHPHLW